MSLKVFYDTLPESKKDILVQFANMLQSSAPPEKLERLRDFHAQLKEEIEAINRRRKAIADDLASAETIMAEIEQYTRKGNENADTATFQAYLTELIFTMKQEVEDLRPDNKLKKKFDVQKRIRLLTERQRVANMLFSRVIGSPTEAAGQQAAKPAETVVVPIEEGRAPEERRVPAVALIGAEHEDAQGQ